MSFFHQLRHALSDPPPEYLLEISEAGIAMARSSAPGQTSFYALEPGVLTVSPLKDNVAQPEELARAVATLAPPNGKKRRRAALILPDFCTRLTVLDFDSFPGDAAEQLSLVRFRVKKSVPFDVESAVISFAAQPAAPNSKRRDVVVVVAALEIVAKYEAALRAAALHPGLVTVSTLAALNLVPNTGGAPLVAAKLTGRVLTVSALHHNVLRMVRCVELPEVTPNEVFGILQPTIAYMEDELEQRPERVLLCGFGEPDSTMRSDWKAELDVEIEAVHSRFGIAGQNNAGLLGYMQSWKES
ncbi:MAG TPA: hypothetical protein DEH78_16825 [Solibacterales bacterium]|nr:hypothetical protein [Bryobacterales bacterium]